MLIKEVHAREILDSRGNPTVEVDMTLDNNITRTASVPSGASTGSREALELRDNDSKRYNGKGVLNAVKNVNEVIRPALLGKKADQATIDKILTELDGTENKSNLGANAMLGVSLACLKCLAASENKELFEYVSSKSVSLPIPMINIINGGKHAVNNIDIQEFMIVPVVKTMHERIRAGAEVFHELKNLLVKNNFSVGVGDEGGFAPNLENNAMALEFIVEAIKKAGYKPGEDVFIALDVAASETYNKETGTYSIDGRNLTSKELIEYYQELLNRYPILSIEDPFFEDDFESLKEFTSLVGDKIMIVGDDYFVTNEKYLQKGIDMNAGNAILLKANQIGTVTEMTKTILLAKKHNYKTIISHRSGETEDTFIADLAVGMAIPFIKTGSMCRGERIAKYNRLLRIEEKLKK
ncbi:MAG TPA: phosphopyruvate hydratase [Candidatus Onthocola stercoravium]|nr:phosphopyruvate hydratase [Candidatus Onthocola stercoravium]